MVGRGLSIGDPKKKWRKAAEPVPVAADAAYPSGYVQPPADTSGFGGFMNQLKYINRVNPGAFAQLGAGIMANDVAGGISNAGQAMDQGQQLQQRAQEKLFGYREQQKSKNLTRQWLLSQGFDEATVDAAIANPDILASLLKRAEGGTSEVFGNPIYGTDPETGETVVGTYDKQGVFHKIETPDFEVSSGVKTVETETEIVTINSRTGEVIARQSKDVAEGERQKKEGGGRGEALTLYRSVKSKMPSLTKVVDELKVLAKKATYTAGGQLWDEIIKQTGAEPREAAVARTEYINKISNVILPQLRDTFGAAFTQKEGETLRATMGDPNYTPEEKIVVLNNFIEQKQRDVEALIQQADPAAGGDDGDREGDTATGPNGEKMVFRNGEWGPQ